MELGPTGCVSDRQSFGVNDHQGILSEHTSVKNFPRSAQGARKDAPLPGSSGSQHKSQGWVPENPRVAS